MRIARTAETGGDLNWLRYRPPGNPRLTQRIEVWEERQGTPCRTNTTPWRELTEDDWRALDCVGDPLAENFLLAKAEHGFTSMDDFAALATMRDQGDPAAVHFWAAINFVPPFIRFDDMQASRAVMLRNPIGGLMSLFFGSLAFTYRDRNVAAVLEFSGRVGQGGDLVRRAWETLRGYADTMSVDELRPGGSAWRRWVRIRLMHTRVRMGICRSGRWDYAIGIPLSCQSISNGVYVFSNFPVQAARSLGAYISQEEFAATTRVWQWISLLQGGAPELVVADISDQHRASRELVRRRYREPVSHAGVRLTDYYYENVNALLGGATLPRWLIDAAARHVLTGGVSDIPTLAERLPVELEVANSPWGACLVRVLAFANSLFANACRGHHLGRWVSASTRVQMEAAITNGLHGVNATHQTPLG